MANNLSGISYTNNFNNLDGLSIVQADELFIDGTSIDPTNLVPYTGASQTIDLNNQNIKTTRLPTANADLTNKLYVDSAVTTGSGDTLGIVNLNFVRYSGSISDTDLGTYKISSSAVPTTANHLTNKTYVDGAITTATSNKVPYTGGTANVVLTGTNKFQQSYNATVSDTTTVVNRQTLDSAIAGLGAGILNLNNTWGYGNTNDMNGAFASIQPQIANQTNLATGGTDFIGTMPICVLTKPSTYYNLSGAGALGMSVGLDLGYTGGSFTAGASTTITGSWTANTVSNRIATITFDVTSHIGKSLNCVWEGVTPLVFATSPPPFFTVTNNATTVYSSPQPISGTTNYSWNFVPTAGTTTITYTVQSTGTPSVPAFSWTRFTIKQIGASYLAYKPGAKYTATFTNLLGSQNMSFYVYQYNAAGGSGVPIGDIFAIPITTSGQTITITFTPNSGGNTGPIIFLFQPSSANQYVRFDTAVITRADMTITGNIQSLLTVNSQIISANPTGNSGNGTVINMNAFNGAFGSIEAFNNLNTVKLPIILNGYGGNVGIGRTDPSYTLDVNGAINTIGGYYTSNASPATNGYLRMITSGGVNYIQSGLTATSGSTTSLVFGSMYAADEWLRITNDGDVGIGTPAPVATLQVQGTASVCGGTNFANTNNYMASGSLTIGATNKNYGGGGGGWNSNTCGLLLECQDSTEIGIHDAGTTVASFMYYSGNVFTIGRNMGFGGGGVSNVNCAGKLGVQNGSPTYLIDVNTGGSVRAGNLITSGFGQDGYGQVRMIAGSYGSFFRNDGDTTYYLITNSGDQYGQWNGLRPFYITNSTGAINWGTDQYYNYWTSQYASNNMDCFVPSINKYTNKMMVSKCSSVRLCLNTSNWSGTNFTYAFYKRSSDICTVVFSGSWSWYVPAFSVVYATIRIYCQNTGAYYYKTQAYCSNVTYNHTTQPFNIQFDPFEIGQNVGWFSAYFYISSSTGGVYVDGNDFLTCNLQMFPSWGDGS